MCEGGSHHVTVAGYLAIEPGTDKEEEHLWLGAVVLGRTWIITTMTSSTVSSSASPHPHTFNFHYGLVAIAMDGNDGGPACPGPGPYRHLEHCTGGRQPVVQPVVPS